MEIDLRGRAFPFTEALADHARRRLAFAFTKFGSFVHRIVLRLDDVNGPKGGEDLACHIELHLSHGGILTAEDRGADAYAVISRTADRSSRRLARLLDRRG